MKRQIRNAFCIQFINSFSLGIITIALPLLMEDRGIDIISIGLIYAALPIIFQIIRMGFSILSDFVGRKMFFLSAGILNAFSNAIYYFASRPLGFLFGKVVEGAKEASVWSVNRPFIMENSKDKNRDLIRMKSVDSISTALGSIIAGFIIVWLFYPNTMLVALLIGLLTIPFALSIKDKKIKRFDVIKASRFLDQRRKSKSFKMALILLFLLGLSYGLIAGYVFPLFLKDAGFNVETIGILFGAQVLIAGVFTYFSTGRRIRFWKFLLFSGMFYFITLLLLGISSILIPVILIIFFLLFGIASGIVDAGTEGIFARVTDSKSYSTDIGMLFMGFHAARTISLILSGFLIEYLGGFIAPISLSAFIFIGYFVLASKTFRKK